MRVRGVANVREVEEVVVVADLESRAGGVEDLEHGGDELDVALAEDAGGSEGDGKEWGFGLRGAGVGGYDGLFGFGLCLGVSSTDRKSMQRQ